MNLKKNISKFKMNWLSQSTSDRPIVIISGLEGKRKIFTEFDLRLLYIKESKSQITQRQIIELQKDQLEGYSLWLEKKLLEFLNR